MKKYLVWRPDHGAEPEDGKEILAYDHEDAVCKWADQDDCESADYSIVGGNNATVKVRCDGIEKTMIVSGETVAHYRAREVK